MHESNTVTSKTSDSESGGDPRLLALAEWEAVQVLAESLWLAGGHADKDSAALRPLPQGEWLL